MKPCGTTFERCTVAGAQAAELRDIHAFDADTACLISCQPARIYRTSDGGATFRVVHSVADHQAFLDGISFFDRRRGLAFGDPDGEHFLVLWTDDAGVTWHRVAADHMPAAVPGEGAFAASGTCLAVRSNGLAWIGTGIAAARVFVSSDFGRSFHVYPTEMGFGKMKKGPRRRRLKRISAHTMGPGIALLLFGSKVLVTPRRGWWGYLTAAAMGWAGTWAAVAWHHRKKKAKP